MARKKKEAGNIIRKEEDQMTQAILAHPVMKKIQGDLDNLQSMLKQLPEAIGRAVNETMKNQPPMGASGPAMPLIEVKKGIEIHRDESIVDGENFKLDDKPGIEGPANGPRVHKKKK